VTCVLFISKCTPNPCWIGEGHRGEIKKVREREVRKGKGEEAPQLLAFTSPPPIYMKF